MNASHLFAATRRIAQILDEIESTGMRLELGGDFTRYRNVRKAQTDRNGPFPMFDVSNSFVDESNAFWVLGYDDKDELIHTQAVRALDLSNTTLAQHLDVHRHKYQTPSSTPHPDQTYFSRLAALNQISGHVCFHGEFWVRSDKASAQSHVLTSLMSRIAFEIAHRTWNPDFMFGFVPMQLAMKGIPFQYGYSRCEPGAWIGPNQETTAEESLVWMPKAELEQYLATMPQSLPEHEPEMPHHELPEAISAVA